MMQTTAKANSLISEEHYKIELDEILNSTTSQYRVLKFLGKGTYGQVVKCSKKGTNQTVAVKIFKKALKSERQCQEEFRFLQRISQENDSEFSFVRVYESFNHKNHACLVMELLELSLKDFMKQNKSNPLPLKEIRPITQQVLTALHTLKSLKIIHGDLKPENIMLMQPGPPFRIKIIDFGCSSYVKGIYHRTSYLQTRYYRAPEIILGGAYFEGIDMWSLGCILAELYLGYYLYPGSSSYDQIRYIVETQGLPPDDMLSNSYKATNFFYQETNSSCPFWRLKTPEEAGVIAKATRKYTFYHLDDIAQINVQHDLEDSDRLYKKVDRLQFIDLLKKMLSLDYKHRIAPSRALTHSFVTLRHILSFTDSSNYVKSSVQMMAASLDINLYCPSNDARSLFNQLTKHLAHSEVGPYIRKLYEDAAAAARADTPQQAAQSCISSRDASFPRMYPLAKIDDPVLQVAKPQADHIQPILFNQCFAQPQVATVPVATNQYEVASAGTNPSLQAALSCLPSSCSWQKSLNYLAKQDNPVLQAAQPQALHIKPTLLNQKNSQVCSADKNRVSESLLPVAPLEVKDNHPCKNAAMHSQTQSNIEIIDLASESELNSSPDFSEEEKLIEMPDPRERGSYIKVNWNYAYLKDCDLNPYVNMGERVSCFRCKSPLNEFSNKKAKVEVLDPFEKEKVKCGASKNIFLKNCDLNPYVDMGERVKFSNEEIGIFIRDASKEVPVKKNVRKKRKIRNLSSLKKTSIKIDSFQVAQKCTSEIIPDKKQISSGTKGEVSTGKGAADGKTSKGKPKVLPQQVPKIPSGTKGEIGKGKAATDGKTSKGKPKLLPQQEPKVLPQQRPKDFEKDFKKEKTHIWSVKGRE